MGVSVIKHYDINQDLLSHLSSACSLFLFYVSYPYPERFDFVNIFKINLRLRQRLGDCYCLGFFSLHVIFSIIRNYFNWLTFRGIWMLFLNQWSISWVPESLVLVSPKFLWQYLVHQITGIVVWFLDLEIFKTFCAWKKSRVSVIQRQNSQMPFSVANGTEKTTLFLNNWMYNLIKSQKTSHYFKNCIVAKKTVLF